MNNKPIAERVFTKAELLALLEQAKEKMTPLLWLEKTIKES